MNANMTLTDFYDVVTFFAMCGTVIGAVAWCVARGPDWYRRKRAAAIEFHREARIREQAPSTMAEAFSRLAKQFEQVARDIGDTISEPIIGKRGTVQNPSDPSPRRRP